MLLVLCDKFHFQPHHDLLVLKVLEDELQKLDAFRETKMQMEAEIKRLEDKIEDTNQVFLSYSIT